MARGRSPRKDSINELVDAHRLAREGAQFEWPVHIDLPKGKDADVALNAFNNLQLARNPRHWRPHHIDQLAELALMIGQRQKLVMLLVEHGPITENARGAEVVSPLLSALSALQSTITQSLKPLGLSATQLENDSKAGLVTDAQRSTHPMLDSDPNSSLLA